MQLRTLCGLTIVLLAACRPHFGGVIHRVEKGQSLLEISHLYDVEVQELLAANPAVGSDDLTSGENILIPKATQTRTRPRGEETVEQVTALPEAPGVVSEPAVREPGSQGTPPPAKPVQTAKKTPAVKKHKDLRGTKFRLLRPADGPILSGFGKRREKMHNGIDIGVNPGAPIRCAMDGEVVYRGRGVAGYGDLVIVRHEGFLFTVYAYLGEIRVNVGDKLRAGEVLALALKQGPRSFLHFEFRQGKLALDPMNFLR